MKLVRMDRITEIKNKVRISEWSDMVRACRDSGLTVQQWCNSNGINIKTYYYRLRKVRESLCEDTYDIVQIPINSVNADYVTQASRLTRVILMWNFLIIFRLLLTFCD